MQATQYHNSGSHDGSKAGQIKRKRHDKFQAPEGNHSNNNSMVVLRSLSWKSFKILKSVFTRLQKVWDSVRFGVAKKGEDQASISLGKKIQVVDCL